MSTQGINKLSPSCPQIYPQTPACLKTINELFCILFYMLNFFLLRSQGPAQVSVIFLDTNIFIF